MFLVLLAVVGALGALCATSILLQPKMARADDVTPKDSDPMVMKKDRYIAATDEANVHLQYMRDENTGRIVYCKNSITLDPPADGSSLEYAGEAGNALLDYIIYHGYTGDDSITIGSITGDGDALYLATQLAIYDVLFMDQGVVYSDHYYRSDSQYRAIADAATTLFNEAKAYVAAGAGGPEQGHAIWYHGTSRRQDIITIKIGGNIRIQKSSSAPSMSASDTGYSLEGAEFTIYSDEQLTQQVATLVTDASGTAVSPYLPYGDYWVREARPPHGFAAREDTMHVSLSSNLVILSIEDDPLYALVTTVLTKVDAETSSSVPLGAASLEGARFKVSYYAGATDPTALPENPTRTWTLQTDDNGTVALDNQHLVEGDDLYTDGSGTAGIPMGVVVVQETQAPAGYLLPDDCTWTTVVDDSVTGTTLRLVGQPVKEQVIRGDICFDKRVLGTDTPMAHILFRVTSKTTGESHLVMTDDNGNFSSRAHAHSTNTNALDMALEQSSTIDGAVLTDDYGTWFYGSSSPDVGSTVNDNQGAFPYDTYVFEELASKSTVGFELTSFEVTVNDNETLVDKGVITDPAVTLATDARDAKDGDRHLDASKAGTIEDTVTYTGLVPQATYTLECTLVESHTGNPLHGEDDASYTKTITFVPASSNGSTTVSIDIDPTSLEIDQVVVFERLLRNGSLIATHMDADDPNQTVHLSRISTELTDHVDDGHTVVASSHTLLDDTVSCRGLIEGQTYLLKGSLVNGTSGEPLLDAQGQEVTATTTFTAKGTSATAVVSFDIDTTTMGDHTLVAYETLSTEGVEVCSHADLQDKNQTVTIKRHDVLMPQTGGTGTLVVGGVSSILLMCGMAMFRRPR